MVCAIHSPQTGKRNLSVMGGGKKKTTTNRSVLEEEGRHSISWFINILDAKENRFPDIMGFVLKLALGRKWHVLLEI